MSKLGIRSVALLGLLAAGLIVSGIGLGAYYQSPDEAALRQSPTVVAVTDPVRDEVLEDDISFRGRFVPAVTAPLRFAAGIEGRVVTGVEARPGLDLRFGDAVIEVEGRPVIALPGSLPTWRDFRSGMPSGPDVRQLQVALRELRLYEGRVTGRFSRATLAAVRRLYAEAGYRAPLGAGIPQGELVFVPGGLTRVSDVHVAAGDRMLTDAIEVTSADYRINATISSDARSAIGAGDVIELVTGSGGSSWSSTVATILDLQSTDEPGQSSTGILVTDPISKPDGSERTFRIIVASTSTAVLTAAAAAVQVSSAGNPYVVRLEGNTQRIIEITVGLVTADRVEVRPVHPATLRPADLLVLNPGR